jgi:hypothetical protein
MYVANDSGVIILSDVTKRDVYIDKGKETKGALNLSEHAFQPLDVDTMLTNPSISMGLSSSLF